MTKYKYKRQYRELSQETKDKISNAQKNKKKSADHKLHISQSMTKYWQSVPNKPINDNNSIN